MRIACFTHTPELYGANLSMLAWIRALQARGFEFLIIGPEGALRKSCEDSGLVFFAFQPAWWAADPATMSRVAVLRSLLVSRFAHPRLVERVRAFQPDWVYSNSSVMPLGWIIGRRLHIPHAWHLREFIDLDFGYVTALGGAWTRKIFRRAEVTISVSYAVQRHLLPKPRAADTVIYEGIGPRSHLQTRIEAGRSYPEVSKIRGFHFVLVGMLQVNKGQALALQAMGVLKTRGVNAHLTLVGGGDPSTLRALAKDLAVSDRVIFTGHMADPMPVVLQSHASLMMSRAEAFGRTTVEAMSLGRPVIALNRGATPEIIEHERTGLLCDAQPETLADAMTRLIQNPKESAAIGQRAAEASLRYTDEAYAEGMEQLFQQKHC